VTAPGRSGARFEGRPGSGRRPEHRPLPGGASRRADAPGVGTAHRAAGVAAELVSMAPASIRLMAHVAGAGGGRLGDFSNVRMRVESGSALPRSTLECEVQSSGGSRTIAVITRIEGTKAIRCAWCRVVRGLLLGERAPLRRARADSRPRCRGRSIRRTTSWALPGGLGPHRARQPRMLDVNMQTDAGSSTPSRGVCAVVPSPARQSVRRFLANSTRPPSRNTPKLAPPTRAVTLVRSDSIRPSAWPAC
jgi:hypothetical protein